MSYQQAVPRDGQAGAITSIAVGVIAGILYFVPAGATAFNITLAVLMLVLSITGLIMGILSLRTKSKAAGIVGIIVSFIPLALLGLAFLGGFMQGVQEGLNSGNGSSSSQSAGSQQ